MSTTIKITDQFGKELAELLASKIALAYPKFSKQSFITEVDTRTQGKTYTERVTVIANVLHKHLPESFDDSAAILASMLGPENPNETGMFSQWYWLMPVAKYVEVYGIDHLETSLIMIEQITKRGTGEYAIRPFIRRYPEALLRQMRTWALSDNFHVRRLASEGLRPKLPWSPKLDTFNDDPARVFAILELLKEDDVMYVKKSVANHLTDWLKVSPIHARKVIASWRQSKNAHTLWIVARATRKIS